MIHRDVKMKLQNVIKSRGEMEQGEERVRKEAKALDGLNTCSTISCTVAMASSIVPALILCAVALILCSSPAEAQGDLALDCCLMVSHKPIPKQILLSYRKLFRSQGCPRDAVVFTTRKGLRLCSPLADEAEWVQDTIKFLDTRLRKCKETKFRAKGCHALKHLSE